MNTKTAHDVAQLTPDEVRLLTAYRKATAENRQNLLGFAEFLAFTDVPAPAGRVITFHATHD